MYGVTQRGEKVLPQETGLGERLGTLEFLSFFFGVSVGISKAVGELTAALRALSDKGCCSELRVESGVPEPLHSFCSPSAQSSLLPLS